MDKYEFNIKTEQIKKLIRKKQYEAAAKVADTMDFSKVKNNALLITVADVYEVVGNYDRARDILVMAYERAQLGRQIAFRLTRISVKRRDIEEAIEYYEDFVAVAPKDASKYILQYEISKLKGEPIERQIAILEHYVEDDMDDKWTFELAKLYHKSGNTDKCVELCDTIILWFSEGKYVDKAMELKMLHAPLTKSQQEKYDKRWEEPKEQVDISEIKVKEVQVDNKYDTTNIQAEIAKSMVELFGESPTDENADLFKPDVDKTKDISGDISENISEDVAELEKTKVIPSMEIAKEMFFNMPDVKTVPVGENSAIQAADISVSAQTPEMGEVAQTPQDDQIEGQITLDELLSDMYKPIEETDEQEATELPEMEAPEELEELEELEDIEDIEELDETETIDDVEELDELQSVEELMDADNLNELEDVNSLLGVTEEIADEVEEQEIVQDESEEIAAPEEMSEEIADENTELESVAEQNLEEVTQPEGLVEEKSMEEESVEEELAEEGAVEEGSNEQESNEQVEKEQESAKLGANLLGESKQLIKDFLEKYSGVEGLDKQVIKAIQTMIRNNENNDYMYVMGDVKSGKTTLAMEIIKLMGKVRNKDSRKIAKVNGTSFTERNIKTFAEKLGNCDVVIEKATSISANIYLELFEILDKEPVNRIVVFEDEKTMSEKYMVENKEVAKNFDCIIKLKQNEVKDWAKIAVEYAKTQDYTIDEMGLLALHAKIDQLYTITLVIHKNHVEQLIDLAIKKSQKKSIGKVVKGLFGKGNAKNKILTEADFMND